MSSALSKAIYARLAGTEVPALTGDALAAQVALAALLGVDPDTSLPAVHFGNKNDAAAVYPLVTFRPSAGAIDGRFADGLAMEDALYDLEIWEASRSALTITDIGEQVERLLDRRRQIAPALPLPPNPPPAGGEGGKVFWAETFTPLSVLWDTDYQAWFGLLRYRFVEARY